MFVKSFVIVLICLTTKSQFQITINNFPFNRFSDNKINDTENFDYEYDFIIIGAGSGGSVVANRLSENSNWNILLLENGKEENFVTDIPLIAPIHTITSFNWGYKSEKLLTACRGLIGQKCNIPRGKALGGTSVINFLIYTRGNKLDYDEWASLGNYGWSYKEVLPYFIKSENCTLFSEIDPKYHGTNGYLNIENPKYESPMVKLFIKTGLDLGYKNTDPNGKYGLGFSKIQATMKDGSRCSAFKAFLKPILHRKNLKISKNSRVVKILINPERKQAYGVAFIKNKKKFFVKIRKEVILSAGSINSPHLLMLSGIGPKEDLERVNIPVIKNLNVGYNLQDHISMSTIAFLVNQSVTISDLKVQNPIDIFNYLVNGAGPYTIPGGAEALAFVQTKYNKKIDYPDIELVLGAGALNGDIYGSLRSLLGIPDDLFNQVYRPLINIPSFSIVPILMRPKSKGRIIIKDSNPLHWPIIRPNYFQIEQDVKTLVEGIKMAIEIASSRHFQKYGTRINNYPFPGCKKYTFGSDAYWSCAVQHVATTLGHQVGTCKMGPSWDLDAVVDPELKVYGIEGLRVVDGSIMPNIIAGHTNSVIMMIGEKAADLIKNEWEKF